MTLTAQIKQVLDEHPASIAFDRMIANWDKWDGSFETARDRFNDITREAGCSNKAPASNSL